jgi:hypothetical protein
VLKGQQHLVQFLRLKAASQMLTAPAAGGAVVAGLRAELASLRPVEVAGYLVSPALAAALEAAAFRLPANYTGSVTVMEVSGVEREGLSPASAAALAKLQASGIEVSSEAVHGPSFWQTLEIELAPELIPASIAALERVKP